MNPVWLYPELENVILTNGDQAVLPHLTVLSEEDLMGDIQKRLDNVRQMIQSQDFLEGKGLSNEVNIRIFCYEPRDEMAVRHFIDSYLQI